MRLLLTIQYLGTRYAGWQTQANATGIQQVIEGALTTLFKEPVTLHGAGRTDAGVHAEGQRAHFDAPFEIPPRGVLLGLNDLLPHDIRVCGARAVADDFHARFSAVEKTYRYQVWNGDVADVFHAPTHAHLRGPLDLAAMIAAARSLEGTHDFRAYTVADPERSTTVRTIREIAIEAFPPRLSLRFTADGFLRYQVRRMAGQLLEIGRGRLPAEAAAEALEPGFREARWTAPPGGLILERVGYGSGID